MRTGMRRRPSVVTLLGGFLLALALWVPAAGAAVSCVDTVPTGSLLPGTLGTGWTVSSGEAPEPFDVEVLGVLPDGVGPGRDMIIVDTSSPAIERAGGIWYGMSGSPVYVDGKLIGALAFGLSWGPSSLAGLTPAEDLVAIADYGSIFGSSAHAPAALPQAVALPAALKRTIAASTGTTAAEIGRLERLRVPIAASGLSARGMNRLDRFVTSRKLGWIPYAGSSAGASAPGDPASVVPGGNFAAALSYGDITLAGIGTTTYVCDGKAIAFGHPMLFTGPAHMGANVARAITVVDDSIGGSYKLATVGGMVGVVDQDRLAGIRAALGPGPVTTPVRSWTTALDTGRERVGRSDVVTPELVPFVSFLHLFTNIDTTFDAIGRGRSALWFRVQGTRADGSPWELVRFNHLVSDFDISIETARELAMYLDTVAFNPIEEVEVTSVEASASVGETVKRYAIRKVLTAVGGRPFVERTVVRARPGDLLAVRVVLAGTPPSAEPKTVDLKFRIPRTARRGGILDVSGAPRGFPRVCSSEESCEEGTPVDSFDGLLALLSNHRTNNVLAADLYLGRSGRLVAQKRRSLDRYVRGSAVVMIALPGDRCCVEGPDEEKPSPPPEEFAD